MGEPTGRDVFYSYGPYFGNNAPTSDNHRSTKLQIFEKKCALTRLFSTRFGFLLTVAVALASCKPANEVEAPAADAAETPVLMCGNAGRLQTELYGAISLRLDWHKNDLECAGMPRPEGRGARLRFAGKVAGEERRIVVIIAIPELPREALGSEYASNVTVIEEGDGRFFSTSNLDNCLTDVTSLEALDDTGDLFSIGGILYCVSPLPEVNGDSSVLITELKFSGLLDWSSS
ncbi:MAG: hypothetical protein OEU90_03995 [Gammaproteobacteria bacterium]|nr:hypothetical protein [Gammaproteobacteria bacterium]MDH3749144.1 hypothetical protein [Gammaproteobacteria bacterium]MDH3804618.1 hypothetical protein [Gammaproteobacteria bacterium]